MRKNYFYIGLLLIYILFLCKDSFYGFFDNKENIENYLCTINNYEEEYNRLLKLMDLNQEENNIIYSKILLRDIYEFYNKITILKGSNSGIKKGDAVISEYGLIGIVQKAYDNYSEVSLITNHNSNISVKINDSYGILSSIDGKLIVKNIKLNHEINVGDKVYTSGLTSLKAGLEIGTIKSVNKDSLELEYIVEVEQENNLMNIKYVGVIPS